MENFSWEKEGETVLRQVSWIGGTDCESPILCGEFIYTDKKLPVFLYSAALGFCEIFVNGKKVSDRMFSPVWSDYHERNLDSLIYSLQDEGSYSHYFISDEITALLYPGKNTVAAWLGNGWYNQKVRTCEGQMSYGLPKVKLAVVSGGSLLCGSGDSFRFYRSPIKENQIYIGEVFDGRENLQEMLSGSAEGEKPVLYPEIDSVLRPQKCPSDELICSVESGSRTPKGSLFSIAPVLLYTRSGVRFYDAGGDVSGRISIVTSASAGEIIKIQYAEGLDESGFLSYRNTEGVGCLQEDVYISNGQSGQRYGARFVCHGFRYFTVAGNTDQIFCDLIYTRLEERNAFYTGVPEIDEILDLYKRAQLTNMHSGVPSDCPHRERLGYTGDGWLTADATMYFWQAEEFYRKWLRDIADGQCRKTGHVRHTAPFAGGGGGPGGWGGAIVFLPWKIYKATGKIDILSEYYCNMNSWLGYLERHSPEGLLDSEEAGGWCLGDWCNPGETQIPQAFVNSCLYIFQLEIMCRILPLLERNGEEDYYRNRMQAVRTALRIAYIQDNEKGYLNGMQGANAFAYAAGLLTEKAARHHLAEYENKPLDTGIFGTPVLFWALFDLEMGDVALNLLKRTEYPSFGFMLKNGATTLWETFEGKVSRNHPMFGGFIASFLDYWKKNCV